ncbi:Hypothetical predicted protein [Octopus vulgaris]|uniref:Uncharacterized protein n=1 Tax=Octopus vulgaris TaxID=6645 RepID=A0AA36FEM0_OCTVU|nr:Hypothetical predicted protein [Octopus vulgaris]
MNFADSRSIVSRALQDHSRIQLNSIPGDDCKEYRCWCCSCSFVVVVVVVAVVASYMPSRLLSVEPETPRFLFIF